MRLEKKILAAHPTRILLGLFVRAYRWVLHGGLLYRHDPALLELMRSKEPAIFACWHQDFFYTLGYLSKFNVRRATYALASGSRDGGLATAAAGSVGFRGVVRGSSARGGARALLALHRLLGRGDVSLAVVSDGPRPPARILKPGVLHLAKETGIPLWLIRTSYQPVFVFEGSWARFFVPGLAARAVALADGPIHVPRDLDREGLERLRVTIEARLNALAEAADRAVGRP